MIGESVYHKIKSTIENKTVRETAEIAEVSPNTVQKYAKMSLEEANTFFPNSKRYSQFDIALKETEELLSAHPQMKAPKVLRKIQCKYPEISCKERALRNYIKPIREKYKNSKIRYYHPVIENKEKCQVQVDPGEFTVKQDKFGKKFKVYFVVFIFSYSRMMFVSYQERPYKTEDFIKAHLEAFQYFGGIAKEFVYDQTKLVVIQEKYREVWFNKRFHQFSTKHEFLPVVCEGYDPESKGKVERAVQYVKNDFLYGDYFSNIESVRKCGIEWLNEVSNIRIHSTTGKKPLEMFNEEKPFLRTDYHFKNDENFRNVDKVGLISYKGNKYTVPHEFQRKSVVVVKNSEKLEIYNAENKQKIASHSICLSKNAVITNTNHYRNIRKNIEELTQETLDSMRSINFGTDLIFKLKKDNPKIVRDQLYGIQKLLTKFTSSIWNEILPNLLELPILRCSIIEENLLVKKRKNEVESCLKKTSKNTASKTEKSTLCRSLTEYNKKVKNAE